MALDDPTGNSAMFSGVEELEEAARALGWNVDYRQLDRRAFSADLASLESESLSLSTERFNGHLHIQCEPPEGFFGLCLPRLAAGRARACGRAVTDGDLIVFPSGSELEFVTRGEIRGETVLLPEAEFRAAARSLAPSDARYAPGSAAIHHGDPRRFAAVQRHVDAVHRNGGLDPETASSLLAGLILGMEDASSSSSADRLANGAAAAVARRARTFVEDRFRDTIRLEDLCAFAGVGLRTLQRCFASYFQISPLQYIKARRLNAARRDLVASDPSGHSVATIATRNGFSHLGRFSVGYREHFGESPSQTLMVTSARANTDRERSPVRAMVRIQAASGWR